MPTRVNINKNLKLGKSWNLNLEIPIRDTDILITAPNPCSISLLLFLQRRLQSSELSYMDIEIIFLKLKLIPITKLVMEYTLAYSFNLTL